MSMLLCYLMVLVIRIKIEQEKVQEVLQSIEPSTLTPDGQAFYHYLEDSLLSVLPFPIELQVNGKQGLYLYCTAVCFSMLSGHMTEWMIWSRKSRSKDPLMSMIGDTPRYRRNSDLSVFQDVDDKGTHPSDVRIALNQLVNQQWKRWSVVLLMVSNVILFVCATNISFIYAKFTFPFVNQKDKHWTVFEGLCDVFGMHRAANLMLQELALLQPCC